MTFALLLGLGLATFLILYFVLSLPEEHFLLKLLGFFFVIALLIMIPKAVFDIQDQPICEHLLNSTAIIDNTTTYDYELVCSAAPLDVHNTKTTFLKAILWFSRIFWVYIFVYINWWFWLEEVVKKSRFWKKMQQQKKLKHG